MENKFIKVGNSISFKSKTDGLDYNLEAGKVYTVTVDNYTDAITLNIAPDLQLPAKIYETNEDKTFISKVINRYKTTTEGTTGVLLSGLKGSGKTVMIKNIAIQSELPIILIDKGFRPRFMTKLFNELADVEVCVIFDEIDKLGEDYDDDYLLRILDGANSSGKKLVLCTCNDENEISPYLKDRCSRIRYWKKFDEISASMIQEVLEDKLTDKTEVKPLTDFILEEFGVASFDNINAFVDEVNAYPNETYKSLFNDMNLTSK